MPLHSSTSRRLVIFSFRWSSVNCRLSLAFSWALRRWSISRRTRASILVGSATASEVSTFIMFDSLTVLTTSHHQHFTVLKEIQHDNKTLKGGGGGLPLGGSGGKRPMRCRSCLSCNSAIRRCRRIFFCSFLVSLSGFSSTRWRSPGAGSWMGCWT